MKGDGIDQLWAAQASLFPLPSVPLLTQTSGGLCTLRTAQDSSVNLDRQVSSWAPGLGLQSPAPPRFSGTDTGKQD